MHMGFRYCCSAGRRRHAANKSERPVSVYADRRKQDNCNTSSVRGLICIALDTTRVIINYQSDLTVIESLV